MAQCDLLLVRPDVAENYRVKSIPVSEQKVKLRTSSLGSQAVQRVVALAHSPNLTAKSEGGGCRKRPAVGIDVGNGDLDRSVVLGGDEAVYGSIFSLYARDWHKSVVEGTY